MNPANLRTPGALALGVCQTLSEMLLVARERRDRGVPNHRFGMIILELGNLFSVRRHGTTFLLGWLLLRNPSRNCSIP